VTKELVTAFSSTDLRNRRQHLRRQRGVKSLQTGWRLLVVGGFAGGMFWVTTLPDWVIRRPEQVAIEGNQWLSPKSVRSLLDVSYPQSLLRLHPDALAKQLEAQGPIASATVRRQLFPPSLTIYVRERTPVAIAYLPNTTSVSKKPVSARPSAQSKAAGLLDDQGAWIPIDTYQDLNPGMTLPQLKVTGDPQWYKTQWSKVYKAIRSSPVTIVEMDWQDRSNLILKTDWGLVYCGADSNLLPQQLQMLDRMRQLPEKIEISRVAYVDLRKPEAPYVQMKPGQPPAQPQPNP
jgi:cell division protein FtsQ